MIDFKNHDVKILRYAPLQYQDEDVYKYLCENGRTRALDKDVLYAKYIAILDNYYNGCCWPPLWYWRIYINIHGNTWLSGYYSELEKKYGK